MRESHPFNKYAGIIKKKQSTHWIPSWCFLYFKKNSETSSRKCRRSKTKGFLIKELGCWGIVWKNQVKIKLGRRWERDFDFLTYQDGAGPRRPLCCLSSLCRWGRPARRTPEVSHRRLSDRGYLLKKHGHLLLLERSSSGSYGRWCGCRLGSLAKNVDTGNKHQLHII